MGRSTHLLAVVLGLSCRADLARAGEAPPAGQSPPAAGAPPAAGVPPAGEAAPVTAGDRDFWAFRKLSRPAAPRVEGLERARTPADLFILEKLEGKGLSLSPEAGRETLLRRAHLDLLGLPPGPEEVEAFLADPAPDSYERVLDRLLASPQFGVRWGRHWLDAAGYVDVSGGDNDAGTVKLAEGKWRYRDYVVRCFNEDRPYDRFLREQLAGDEMVDWRSAERFTPRIEELLVATGFLRTSADDTDENELNTADIRHGVLARTVEIVAQNLLALTVQCARCHSHKYDPIPQEDYYRLTALFTPAFNPRSWLQPKDRALPDVSALEKKALEAENAALSRKVEELGKRLADLCRPTRERLREAKLQALPEPIRADTRAALDTPAEKQSEVQKYLARKLEAQLAVKEDELRSALDEAQRSQAAALDQEIAELRRRTRRWGTIQAVYDVGAPPATHLLRRGSHETPGPEVEPGFLSVLCAPEGAAAAAPSSAAGKTSGRRLALARWLTEPGTPASALAARVLVNRAWQHLFGAGIVETPDNFGRSGTPPTHAELLDRLAGEFIENGLRLKPLLRLLMTSSVYRQSSALAGPAARAAGADPGNRLLSRMRLRRLESEIVRDSILALGGGLDLSLGGPPVPLEARPDGMVVVKEPAGKRRRSLYLLARRNYNLSLLGVFDQPLMTTQCVCRSPSAVVSQSLTMMNDGLVWEEAERFAARVKRSAGPAPERQIDLAYLLALARAPSAREAAWCKDLLLGQAERLRGEGAAGEVAEKQALLSLCHTLLNTSEFLYVE